ncbi:unnamed protein product [Closterium sp. Naga37s-1]|nr:unnamed protein product [Closterium sp. Naga37s-1]
MRRRRLRRFLWRCVLPISSGVPRLLIVGPLVLTPPRRVTSGSRLDAVTILLDAASPSRVGMPTVVVAVGGGEVAVAGVAGAPPLAPAASAAAPGARPQQGHDLRLPWVPPVAGVEFVTAAGGVVTAQYPSLLPVDTAPPAAGVAQPFQALVGPLRHAKVLVATLGQLWRLSESLRAVLLIRVYGQAALSRGNTLDGGPRDECLDAADQLAELLAPVLAAPARGGVAGIGQLGAADRGLRRLLRAGSGANAIAASTLVVRELHRTLTGLLAVLDADQM